MPSLSTTSMRAKHIAKRMIERRPGLKNHRLYYEVQRARAYRKIGLRPELTDRRDLLDELVESGIAVVPGYVPRTQVAAMLDAAEEALEQARAGGLQEHVFAAHPEIFCRIARADRIVPETRPFFEDQGLRSVAQAYMSPDVASYRRELDYRYGISEVAQADLYHFDNWRPICKAFLYLVDVTEDNAPFVYVPKTHRQEAWRRAYNLAYDVGGTSGRFGHFFPQEVRNLRARFGWTDLVCTGEAGTLILADLRGLHRGTPLRAGRRVMLTNVWDLMNPEAD